MGYIGQKLWDILAKTMRYIRKNYGIYWAKILGFYVIYSAKAMGYIWKNYGIYWSIVYILQKLRDILGKMFGYTGSTLWDIL